MAFNYGPPAGPRDVVRWPIDGFAAKLAAAIDGDAWASDLFVRDGQRVLFYLTFHPGKGGETPTPSKLRLHTLGPTGDLPKMWLSFAAWVENSAGVPSARKEKRLRFPFGPKGVGWTEFLTAAELDALRAEETLSICVQLPFEFTRLRMTPADYTYKWEIASPPDFIDYMRQGEFGMTDRSFRLLPCEGPSFNIAFFFFEDDVGWEFELEVEDRHKYAAVYARCILWVQEAYGHPRTAKRECFLYRTASGRWGGTVGFDVTEAAIFGEGYLVDVCCCITALRVERLAPPLEDGPALLQKMLRKAAVDDPHADFAFQTKDGRKFKVPSYLFALHSEYFRDYLERKGDRRSLYFQLEDGHDPEHLRQLIGFLYHGEVEGIGEIAPDLFRLAHRYAVVDLERMCVIQMCRDLRVENLLATIAFAHEQEGTDELRDFCLRFALAKAAEIRALPEWDGFKNKNPKIFNVLLNGGFKFE